MTRAYYSISSGPHGIERCPFCKPKSNKGAMPSRGTKLGLRSESGHPEFGVGENADLQGCLNQSSVSQPEVKMPQFGNSCRSFLREIRILSPDSLLDRS